MTTNKRARTLGVSLTLALVGCASTASTDPVRVEDDFGHSVKQMIDAQTYNPKAAKKPASEPPEGLDGVQGEAILKTYREDVGSPESVREDVRIDVNSGK